MKWTREQQLAIDLEGTNIIVSAGAGSGKTAVLSERVLRKLKEGVDIRNILILTLTNEAAGEMKERIRKKMIKEGLEEQLAFLDASYITTFDAYALSIVKKYHYLFNLDVNLSIIDSSIINLEKKRILNQIIDCLFDEKDENYLALVRDFTNRDDDVIRASILNISNTLDLRYDKEEYLKSYIKRYFDEDYIEQLFQEYFQYLSNLALLIEEDYYALESFLNEKLQEKCYQALAPIFRPRNYQDLYGRKIDLPQFRGLEEDAKEIKDHLKSLVDELKELTVYKEEELKEQIKSTKPYVLAITSIILTLDQKIDAYKKEKNAFEFVDIAKMAIRLVKEFPDIREEIKNSYQEIMIDEYQDTNDLQEMFIREIENHNVYMVGDIKQSIYRFRNANPSIFREKYDDYKNHSLGEKIDLLENFRSRREVLESINEIFGFIMIPELGGVDYLDQHAMVYGNKAYEEAGKTQDNHHLEILEYSTEQQDFTNTEIEAFAILKDIKEKIDNHYQVYDFDLGTTREVTYHDFCIILDRGKEMDRYKKIFEYFHVPLEIYKDSNLTKEEDLLVIRSVIRLVLAIKNLNFDMNMRYYFMSVARSFIGNMSDEEIFDKLSNNTFYDTEIYMRVEEIAKELDFMTPSILLHRILTTYQFYQKLILVGNVGDAIIRLDYFEDLANSVETLGFTIEDFGEYLDEMIASKTEIRYKEAKSATDSVKMMNIHKSKGLEFPICYFAGFKEKFNLRDLQSRFMVDSTYGILTPFYQEGIGTLFTKVLIQNKYLEEEIAEKIRLFYVALTRAKEKIIMVVPKLKESNTSKKIDYLTGMSYRSFYDFLSSISGSLQKYSKTIDVGQLSLTKDYEISVKKEVEKLDSSIVMNFKNLNISSTLLEQAHASKTIESLLTANDEKTLLYGTQIHEMLEETDFKHVQNPNSYVKHLLDTFDFKNAEIYQELEFIFTKEDREYHGIIDLMLEYEDEIKIIDYKLKNIDDDAYVKQLIVYYEYVRSVSDKKISLYLYSIMDHKVKEVEVMAL